MRHVMIAMAVSVALAGCGGQQAEIDQRVRKYFDMPGSQAVTPTSIQSAVLKHLPVGTPANDVYVYLHGRGIGKDGLSGCNWLSDNGDIACRITYNPASAGPVKTSYAVIFTMTQERTLRQVNAKAGLTGL